MTKQNHDSHRVILGLAISSAIGAGLIYYLRSARHRPNPVLHKIGKTIVEVGEMIEDCNIPNCKDIVEKAKHKTPSGEDLMSSFMSWASTGLNLWKTLTKGR